MPQRDVRLLRSTAVIAMVAAAVLAGLVPVASAAPTAPGTFVALAPTRVLDTRTGNGAARTPVAAGGTVHLQVTGRGGVPGDAAGIAAVVLNVTVTDARASGYVTVYPDDGNARPTASNLNFVAGATVPNLVTVRVSTGGVVALYNGSGATVDLLADVEGYYLAGTPTVAGSFAALPPARVLDTRSGNGAPRAPVAGGGTVSLQVTGRGGVPTSGVAGVLLNLTVTGAVAGGYVTAYPGGTVRPTASNINFAAARTIANLVSVPIGANGIVALYNGSGGRADLLADVAGYYLAGHPTADGTFASLAPARLLDTRTGTGAARGPVAAAGTAEVSVKGRAGIPSTGVAAVLLNVTVVNPKAAGYLTVYRDGAARPTASNLNFAAGRTVANLVSVPVSASGIVTSVALYNGSGGSTDVLADVAGYVLATPDNTPPAPVTGLHVTAISATTVGLAWTNPTGSDFVGAMIRRATGPTPPASPTAGTLVTDTAASSITETGLAADTTYSYAVFAHDAVPNYAPAATVSVITGLAPVTSARATATTATSISLAWTNPSGSWFAGVVIRRAVGSTPPPSPTSGTAVTDTAGTTWTDTGLSPGTTYSYALFAHDVEGRDAAGAVVTAATSSPPDTTPPGPVTAVHVTGTTGTTVSLGWTNPTAADFSGVLIRRATGSTPPANPAAGTAVYNFPGDTDTDGGLTAGTTYSYALFAHDAVPNYAPAATITVTTPVGPTGAVMRLGAVDWTKASTYWANPNWADPDVVRLYTDAAGRLGVATYHPAGSTITVQSFDPATRQQVGATRTVTLPAAYPDWGGVYVAPTGDFYVAIGQDNHAQNDALNVVAIQRYNANWGLVGTAYVKGDASQGLPGVYEPFAFGAAHMLLVGGKLVLHMPRLIYAIDGVNHQADLTVEVDVASMTATPFSQLGQYVYSSHSFMQLVTTWNGSLVLLDQGDAYPRAVQMGVYANYPASHTLTTETNLLEFNGDVGDNFTGATLTGVVSGPSGIVAVGNSIAQPNAPTGPQGGENDKRNAYIVAANPATGEHTVTWLTSFAANGTQDAGQPRVVQVDTDRFAVVFTVTTGSAVRTEYRLIDSAGTVLASSTFTGLTFAAGTDPAHLGDAIYWAGQVSGTGYVYGLDVSDPTNPKLITP